MGKCGFSFLKKMDIFCKLYKMYPKPLLNYRQDQHLKTPEYFIFCQPFLYDLITKMQISALFQNRTRRLFCFVSGKSFH